MKFIQRGSCFFTWVSRGDIFFPRIVLALCIVYTKIISDCNFITNMDWVWNILNSQLSRSTGHIFQVYVDQAPG